MLNFKYFETFFLTHDNLRYVSQVNIVYDVVFDSLDEQIWEFETDFLL